MWGAIVFVYAGPCFFKYMSNYLTVAVFGPLDLLMAVRNTHYTIHSNSPAEPLVVYISEKVCLVDGSVAVARHVRLTPAVLTPLTRLLTRRRLTLTLLVRWMAGVIVVHRLGHHTGIDREEKIAST